METLPNDVLQQIALKLSASELMRFCATNKKYKTSICDNKYFWIQKLEMDYPHALYITKKNGIVLANPKKTYIRNFLQIRNAIEKIITTEKAKNNLIDENTEKLENELYERITGVINNTPLDEDVDIRGNLRLHILKYLLHNSEQLLSSLQSLTVSENLRREQLRELAKLKENAKDYVIFFERGASINIDDEREREFKDYLKSLNIQFIKLTKIQNVSHRQFLVRGAPEDMDKVKTHKWVKRIYSRNVNKE